jgi:tetratricopeptide (TPR) repeat protein
MMQGSNLGKSLVAYQSTLAKLDRRGPLEPERVLAVLIARDALVRTLEKKYAPSPKSLLFIAELDEKLKKLDTCIVAEHIPLADWRASYSPSPQAWWWTLDALKPPGRAARFDWLCNALATLSFLVALSLATEIATRFLRGGPDGWGVFVVLAQSVLALLAAGGALTKAGQTAIGRILSKLRAPSRLRHKWRAAIALLLLALTVGVWRCLPAIAVAYNNNGLNRFESGRLLGAQHQLERAVSLQPDYPRAHYNLGLVYEALLEFDQAQTEYQIAMRGGLVAARNNLARLYIQKGRPSEAVHLLLNGLAGNVDVPSIRHSMLKNLGWARLLQERYTEAIAVLNEAIALNPEPAAAHCLLAQALAGKGDQEGAATTCETCLTRARSRVSPEEDQWIDDCRQTLNPSSQGGTP